MAVASEIQLLGFPEDALDTIRYVFQAITDVAFEQPVARLCVQQVVRHVQCSHYGNAIEPDDTAAVADFAHFSLSTSAESSRSVRSLGGQATW